LKKKDGWTSRDRRHAKLEPLAKGFGADRLCHQRYIGGNAQLGFGRQPCQKETHQPRISVGGFNEYLGARFLARAIFQPLELCTEFDFRNW
jgi:hypothetical protein